MKNDSPDPLPQRIAILYSDAKREYFPTDKLYISEAEVYDRSLAIAKHLQKLNIDTKVFPGDSNITENLKKYQHEVHGSIEIDNTAVCQDEKQLKKRLSFLMSTYHQPVLVEEFIMGREITVIVFQGINTKVYAAEKILDPSISGPYNLASFDAVWSESKNMLTRFPIKNMTCHFASNTRLKLPLMF
jgi:hypothetical protein